MMIEDTARATEQNRELTLDELDEVGGGRLEFIPVHIDMHFLNPQPLPPG